jgi:hypothetical protein
MIESSILAVFNRPTVRDLEDLSGFKSILNDSIALNELYINGFLD